ASAGVVELDASGRSFLPENLSGMAPPGAFAGCQGSAAGEWLTFDWRAELGGGRHFRVATHPGRSGGGRRGAGRRRRSGRLLVFVLVAGSDARPGEDLLHTRADSLHLLCINPATGQGTLLGFPRDSWVDISGHGRGKLNNALALGGPDLLAATVRHLTGLPVD